MTYRLHRLNWAPAVLVSVAVAIGGCGGSNKTQSTAAKQASTPVATTASTTTAASSSSPSPSTTTTHTTTTTTPAPERVAPNEKIVLSSPAIDPNGGALQVRYTCDGQNVPMPLKWHGVPPGTAELMINVIKVKTVNGRLSFAWAVAGIPPHMHELVEGKLPQGAIVGTNGNGETKYDFCPPKGENEAYVAVIFALPHKLALKPGFDSVAARHQAERQASYQNLLVFNYTRH